MLLKRKKLMYDIDIGHYGYVHRNINGKKYGPTIDYFGNRLDIITYHINNKRHGKGIFFQGSTDVNYDFKNRQFGVNADIYHCGPGIACRDTRLR